MATRIIDLHMHGIGGSDTRDADPSVNLKMAEVLGQAGVSEILLSIYSGDIEVMRDQMAAVERAMRVQSAASAAGRVPGPAAILGVHLEGPFLNAARCGALDPASFLEPQERTFRRLLEGFEDIVRTATVAPELVGAPELIRTMTKAGIAVNMGHSDSTYAEAEAGFRAGARGVTHLFNGMRPFHHREPGIVGFALVNSEVYVEVIGDLVHSDPHALELVFGMKRPDRIILVSDSVRETEVLQGEVPRDKEGRLLGGSLSLPSAMTRLVHAGFDAEAVARAASENPREYLRIVAAYSILPLNRRMASGRSSMLAIR